jgi:hypothetical protein
MIFGTLIACNKLLNHFFYNFRKEVIMKLNKLKLAVLGALMVPLTAIHAEEAAPAETSDWSISANVGLYSDYILRGYTQTKTSLLFKVVLMLSTHRFLSLVLGHPTLSGQQMLSYRRVTVLKLMSMVVMHLN